ncbi:MAG: cyclic nucleotide-binding domain-containing protein, partial [Deltaproteobacteria bacterium]
MTGDELMLQKFGRNFPKGAVLFRDGELNKEMYVVHSGMVRI